MKTLLSCLVMKEKTINFIDVHLGQMAGGEEMTDVFLLFPRLQGIDTHIHFLIQDLIV